MLGEKVTIPSQFFWEAACPPLSKGLDDRPPPPPHLSRSGFGTASRSNDTSHCYNAATQ